MRLQKHNQGYSGFTVMELLAAITIASILMAVAVPHLLDWLPTLRLSSAARQVATDLQVARMRAISQNASNTITFSGSTYSYNGNSRDVGALFPGITISSAPTNPVFTPRGTASTTGTITLTNGSATKNIVVSAVGRVNIQ